jgi:hypothetical protein
MQTITQRVAMVLQATLTVFSLRIMPSILLLGMGVNMVEAADNRTFDIASTVSISIDQDPNALVQPFSRASQQMNAAQRRAAEKLKQVEIITAARKTREQVIAERLSDMDTSAKLRSASQRLDAGIYHEFSIYEASSRLFEDIDYDGFFRTFSVTFDADVHSFSMGEHADVYADLYLSRNGGPWELYHTTDIFTIIDDASDDDFEVLTTLHTGYPTDHYDVLIDLYEVGYSDIVATISGDDIDDLYGLPLESSDRDFYEEEITQVTVGGSLSIFGLLLVLGATVVRRASFKVT